MRPVSHQDGMQQHTQQEVMCVDGKRVQSSVSVQHVAPSPMVWRPDTASSGCRRCAHRHTRPLPARSARATVPASCRTLLAPGASGTSPNISRLLIVRLQAKRASPVFACRGRDSVFLLLGRWACERWWAKQVVVVASCYGSTLLLVSLSDNTLYAASAAGAGSQLAAIARARVWC